MREMSRYYYVTTHYLLSDPTDKNGQHWESKEEGPFRGEGDAYSFIESEMQDSTFQHAEVRMVVAPMDTYEAKVVDLGKAIINALASRPIYQPPEEAMPMGLEDPPEAKLISQAMEEAISRGETPDMQAIQAKILGDKAPKPLKMNEKGELTPVELPPKASQVAAPQMSAQAVKPKPPVRNKAVTRIRL
jgi:hypothetical protein